MKSLPLQGRWQGESREERDGESFRPATFPALNRPLVTILVMAGDAGKAAPLQGRWQGESREERDGESLRPATFPALKRPQTKGGRPGPLQGGRWWEGGFGAGGF